MSFCVRIKEPYGGSRNTKNNNLIVLMYNEGFTSLKHRNYVEGEQNKYGCHGNRDCYLSPFHKGKKQYAMHRHWKGNFSWILLLHISFKYDLFKSTTQICIFETNIWYIYKVMMTILTDIMWNLPTDWMVKKLIFDKLRVLY